MILPFVTNCKRFSEGSSVRVFREPGVVFSDVRAFWFGVEEACAFADSVAVAEFFSRVFDIAHESLDDLRVLPGYIGRFADFVVEVEELGFFYFVDHPGPP